MFFNIYIYILNDKYYTHHVNNEMCIIYWIKKYKYCRNIFIIQTHILDWISDWFDNIYIIFITY
jgi:hypothetical protein